MTDCRLADCLAAMSPGDADDFLTESSELLARLRANPTRQGHPRWELQRRALLATINDEPTAPAWRAWSLQQSDLVEFRSIVERLYSGPDPSHTP